MAKDYITEREGTFYVADSRVSLDSIVHAFRLGESPEAIAQDFELLKLEDVYGAIAYYLAHQSDVDAYLSRQQARWTESRENAEPLPANLRDRLMQTRSELHSDRTT